MARFEIKAGASVDVLTREELRAELEQAASVWSERGRGEKWLEFRGNAGGATVSTTVGYTFQLGGAGPNDGHLTPPAGYVWNVRMVGAITAAGSATNLFKRRDPESLTVPAAMPVGRQNNSTNQQVYLFSSGQLFMRSGEYLCIGAGTSTTLNQWFMAVVSLPEQIMWKAIL